MRKYNYTNIIWSLGNTSFRQSTLPLKLELACRALRQLRMKYPTEIWGKKLYSEFLKELDSFKIINYAGSLPDKDARVITSFLEQLGLCNTQRYLTNVGEKIIQLSELEKPLNNEFNVSDYAYIYFLQLLKKSFKFQEGISINPFIATLVAILENDKLSEEEFKFFVMTTVDNNRIAEISPKIKEFRQSKDQKQFAFDYIIKLLFSIDSYKKIYQDFVIDDSVPDNEIRTLGVNRKGDQYEEPSEKLYLLLRECNNKKSEPTVTEVETILNPISSTCKKNYWKKLLLGKSRANTDKSSFLKNLSKKIVSMSGKEFREWFLYNWHFNKTCSTLKDYFDLNKRVLSTTELFSFSDGIDLNLFPKAYFKTKLHILIDCANKTASMDNYNFIPLKRLFHGVLVSNPEDVYLELSQLLNQTVNEQNVNTILNEINNQKFNELIASKFSREKVIQIFENIKDQYSTTEKRRIKELEKIIQKAVSEDANTPTIFEYLTAIAWYYISEETIKPLEILNLTLDGDFLPKTHASGGQSDLLIKYSNYKDIADHDLILEVTLTKDSNQRRAEMEPVSRHLGEYKIKNPNSQAYCVFLTHNLDKNTEIHFRQQKITPYYYQGKWAEDNKIIPLVIDNVIFSLKHGYTYNKLYEIFENAYLSDTPLIDWWESEINSKLSNT